MTTYFFGQMPPADNSTHDNTVKPAVSYVDCPPISGQETQCLIPPGPTAPSATRPDRPGTKSRGAPTPVAIKADVFKSRLDLISGQAVEGLGHVLGHGARKYGANNWRLGLDWSRTVAALLRHTFAFIRGEDIDPDSKLPHVDHIMCNAMFLSEYFHTKTGQDDRFKRGTL